MSVVTVGFLVLMVLIGGVVALLADNLGRKIGKKRLKIHHKIRPRHTATLFVVGSGLLIPLLTVGLVSFLSKDVRTWLMEGEQAIADVRQLRPEVERLTRTRTSLQNDIDKLNSSVTRLQLDVRQANTQKLASENESKRLETTKKKLDTQVSGLKSRVDQYATRSKIAGERLSATLRNLLLTGNDLTEKKTALAEVIRQRDDANAFISQLQKEIGDLERSRTELDGQIASLQKSRNDIQAEFNRQKTELSAKQKELDDKRHELIEAEAELKRVQGEVTSVRAVAESNRMRRMIYGFGDEVARIVVGEDLTTTQARNQLNSLFRSARVAAEAVGAKGSGRIGAAGLFDQQIDGQMVTAEQQMNVLVAKTAGVPQSRIIIARAAFNFYTGEPVILDVVAFPNKLSFRSGDVLSEVRIDGDLSSGQILAMLSNWLASDVKKTALEAGMIPAAGRADALASVAPEDVFDLVAQIKSQSRTARVQALAFSDTYAAGPLKLTFRIR